LQSADALRRLGLLFAVQAASPFYLFLKVLNNKVKLGATFPNFCETSAANLAQLFDFFEHNFREFPGIRHVKNSRREFPGINEFSARIFGTLQNFQFSYFLL